MHAPRSAGPHRRARSRRLPSMAGPVSRSAQAGSCASACDRGWKAQRRRRTLSRDEAWHARRARRRSLDFGVPFLFYAVAARQGLLRIIDDLRIGPRDAARAMTLLYAAENAPSAGNCGEWLGASAARLLCPASGLPGGKPGSQEDPRAGSAAARLLGAAGQPGLLPRFLKEFKALADEISSRGKEVAFIDSDAMDAADSERFLPNPFLPQPRKSRWLFAVQRYTGFPLGLAEVRVPGDDDADPAAGPECGWIDQGGLEQAFGVFAEAGIEAQSCLLGGCMLHDPLLDRFYDAEGRLALPYAAIVLSVDPVLRGAVQGIGREELLRPGCSSPLEEGMTLFTATRPVEAGEGRHPAWLHVGYCFLAPGEEDRKEEDREEEGREEEGLEEEGLEEEGLEEEGLEEEGLEEEDMEEEDRAGRDAAGPGVLIPGLRFIWRLAILTGKEMTGQEAFKEYYGLLQDARQCAEAPCRLREPEGASPAMRRGHELFCAAGLAAWGLMEDCMGIFTSDLPSLLEKLRLAMPCILFPGRISLRSVWEAEEIDEAFMAAGIDCPRTVFLDGRRLRYDPLRDFALHSEWVNPDEELLEYLASLGPESLHATLSDRPFWPRRHRPWRMGKGRMRPLPPHASRAGRPAGAGGGRASAGPARTPASKT